MGVRYTRVQGRVDGSTYIAMAQQMPGIFTEEMVKAGEKAAELGRRKIEAEGTGRTWSGWFRGRNTGTPQDRSGAGRVDRGDMRDNFEYRVVHGRGVGLDIGWVHGYEDYFGAQDQGFKAGGFRLNQFIKGMGVVAHVKFEARAMVDEAIDRAIGRVLSGL